MAVKNKKTLIFLLIILAIASFFRLWQLGLVPPGLYPDEAINGNEALDSLENRNFKVFYPENNGREGLFIWLLAFSFSIFGKSIWALKFVPAILGILTVLGLYFLTKELFSRPIALLSSFFLAISFWHTNFSRIGFRAILVPFVLVFAFYFLFSGFRKKKVLCFIISGIFFGLGFYTYISYRFVVLLGTITLISWYFIYKKPTVHTQQNLKKEFLRFCAVGLLFAVLITLPIGIYFLKNPQDFIGRASGVSIFSQENPVYEFGKSLVLHLGMFNIYGDGNWRHNFAGSPMLLLPVGVFFLIGIAFSIKELVVSIKKKNCPLFTPLEITKKRKGRNESKSLTGFIVHCSLLSWFFFMLLPGALSYEGIPHALRAIGVIPVIYIFAALGFYWLFEKIKFFFKTKNQIIVFYLCLSVLLLTLIFTQFNKYFYQWAKNQNVEQAFSKNYMEIGNYLNSLPFDTQKYVIVNQSGVPVPFQDGIPMSAQTPIFIERTKFDNIRSEYLLPKDLSQVKIDKKTVIVPLQRDENLLLEIFELFPWGKFQEKQDFWVYQIE